MARWRGGEEMKEMAGEEEIRGGGEMQEGKRGRGVKRWRDRGER